MKKNNKGFSLAELIVVVLILGILAVAVTPQIMNWVNKSKAGKDEAYAGTVSTIVESLALEYLGKGWSTGIPGTIEISGDPATLSSGSDTPDSTAADGTTKKFLYEVQQMIGTSKLQAPEDGTKTKFVSTITKTTTTVDVVTEAQ